MSTVLPLYFNSQQAIGLWVGFDEQRALLPGAGVHRLMMTLNLDARNTLPEGTVVSLGGTAWIETGGRVYLGRWTTDQPVVVRDEPFTAQLALELTDHQLAVINRRRQANGGGFRLDLEIDATLVAMGAWPEAAQRKGRRRKEPPNSAIIAWPAAHATHMMIFNASQWHEVEQAINAYTTLSVVAALPSFSPGAGEVDTLLREAIRLVGRDEPSKAVVDARRAVEKINDVFQTPGRARNLIRAIVDVDPDARSFEQRLALVEYALFSLASPAAHGDANATSITWNQERASLVIAATLALAACWTASGS